MDNEPENTIRESARNFLRINRRFQREEETDLRRTMDGLRITPTSISDIANKLKTKSSVSVPELQTLKNGLMDDPKHIAVVLNTHGALRGLVRELTGHEVRKQCASAGCLCNLALGDAKAGVSIAKAAGPYLTAALDSLTHELVVPCAWALGNISGSCARAASLLVAQGAPGPLCAALARTEDERDAALYALGHLAYQMRDDLRTEHLVKILEALPELPLQSTSQLLFILSCHKDFNPERLTQKLFQNILEHLPVSLGKHIISCKKTKSCCEVMFLIRTLANLELNEVIYSSIIDSFINNNLSGRFKIVLIKDSDVRESVLWFLGNMFKYSSNNVFFNRLLMLE